VCSDRTRGNGCKLKEGRIRLDMRKKFFTMRAVRRWHRLLREAVAAPSLAVFKARLDGALSNLVWWKVSLPMAGGWNQMIFKVPSSPYCSIILNPAGRCLHHSSSDPSPMEARRWEMGVWWPFPGEWSGGREPASGPAVGQECRAALEPSAHPHDSTLLCFLPLLSDLLWGRWPQSWLV